MDKEKFLFKGVEYTLLDLYSIFEKNSKPLSWQISAAINACDLHLWEMIVSKSDFTLDKIIPFLKKFNLVLFWQAVEKERKDLLLNLRSLPKADLLILSSIDSRFISFDVKGEKVSNRAKQNNIADKSFSKL